MADKKITELPSMAKGDVDGTDLMITYDQQSGITKQMSVDSLVANAQRSVQGYYGVLSSAYDPDFVGAVPTQSLTADTWTQLIPTAFTMVDQSPTLSLADGTAFGDGNGLYDESEGRFCIAGSQARSSGMVRVLIRIDPDEDDSALSLRLNFTTNANTQSTGYTTFQTERLALNMAQGANEFYADEALMTFFVGSELNGDGWDDAGSFIIEANCTVDADIEVNAFTYFIQN